MDQYIDKRADFDAIRYANCWEDADVLCAVLDSRPGKRILSIASAGDNALALLAGGCEVIAADLSPAQLACVEIRTAAFGALEYDETLAFLGVTPSSQRLATCRKLASRLSSESRAFWDAHGRLIEMGIIHAGKFEAYFHKFRRFVLPMVHGRRRVWELLEEKPLDARGDFYRRRWNTWRWRLLFRVFFSRLVMGRLGRDPEFFRYVEGSVADRILARTKYALTELPTHANPYLQYILNGNFGPALPRYLRREHYDAIRAGIGRLTLFQGSVEEAAATYGTGGFDGFNLSDIFEYLDEDTCRSVYVKLMETANPQARFAYWNMLVPRERPETAAERVRSLRALSDGQFAKDLAFFYSRFVVEEVR